MMGRRQAEIRVAARYTELERLCAFVAEGADAAGLSPQARDHVQLAVDEAATNVIQHGYGGEGDELLRVAWRADPGQLTIVLIDQAPPFDPDSIPEVPTPANVDELAIGGYGLRFIRQVMDEVDYVHANGVNRLTLVKRATPD